MKSDFVSKEEILRVLFGSSPKEPLIIRELKKSSVILPPYIQEPFGEVGGLVDDGVLLSFESSPRVRSETNQKSKGVEQK